MTIELVEVAGEVVRVSIEGTGPPLLLLNGLGASLEAFEPFRRRLRATETIAVDLPAIPRRMRGLARLVDALLRRLGYLEVDVLGVSWGGALAQELARCHRARVRRLVLAATSAGWIGVPGSPAALWRLRRLRAGPPPSVRRSLHQLAAIWGWSSLCWLHRVTAPALVLAGDDDPVVPLVNARVLARRLPDARLHVVRGGGHLFLLTHAAAIAPVVECFLRTSLRA